MSKFFRIAGAALFALCVFFVVAHARAATQGGNFPYPNIDQHDHYDHENPFPDNCTGGCGKIFVPPPQEGCGEKCETKIPEPCREHCGPPSEPSFPCAKGCGEIPTPPCAKECGGHEPPPWVCRGYCGPVPPPCTGCVTPPPVQPPPCTGCVTPPPGGGGGTTTPPSGDGGGGTTTPPSDGGGGATSTPPTGGGGSTTTPPTGGGGGGNTPTAEIAVAKSVDNATPSVSSTVHYVVTVSAEGPATSIGVVASDTVPAGLTLVSASTSQGTYAAASGIWTIGDLNFGAKATLTITALVGAGTAGMTIANTAVVSESPTVVDQLSGNNSSTVMITVQGGTTTGGGGGSTTSTVPSGGGSGGGGGGGGGTVGVPSGGATTSTVPSGGGGGGGSVGVPATSTSPGQVLGAQTSCGVYLNDYIHPIRKYLNDPNEVMKLQQFLNKNLGIDLPVTGYYGPLTIHAVDQFQVKYHIEVLRPWVPYGLANEYTSTDYVYKTTKRWINMIMCPALNLPVPPLP